MYLILFRVSPLTKALFTRSTVKGLLEGSLEITPTVPLSESEGV